MKQHAMIKAFLYGSFALAITMELTLGGCSMTLNNEKVPEPVDYVNPYMGNISHILVPTYPTIHLPNSMLRVYPERKDYTGDRIKGLPIIVTSHRGSSAFNLSFCQGNKITPKPVISYNYNNEVIKPYYYTADLSDPETQVRYAPSHQSGIYELSFREKGPVHLIINSKNGELTTDGNAISGYQQIKNFPTRVYLYMETNLTPISSSVLKDSTFINGNSASGKNAAIALSFEDNTSDIKIRYGISFINEEQAKSNLNREIFDYDLDRISSEGRKIWNQTLSKILVEGDDYDEKVVFYTSLYRTYERMICISEDGRYYSAFDGKIHEDNGKPFYTDDWIWDTYRATHPLRVIIEPEMEMDMINSFIRMAEQMDNFWMPTFPEVTGDSRRMNSNHGVATVIDSYNKGLKKIDLAKAYKACKKGITEKTLAPWSGAKAGVLDDFFKKEGYFPALPEGAEETVPEIHSFEKRQPVAVTLGTVYDEWCLSQIAKELGYEDDYKYFSERSLNYRKLYNEKTGFFHPKDKNGKFIEPFDYRYSGGRGAREFYGENNGWIYRWDVPHNISDLIKLMGGPKNFVRNLETMYNTPLGKSKNQFYAILGDHTGNVGQFSMSNEPSFHIPYLYNYAGEPWKTQKKIRTLLNEWFRNDLMGVPGDEDGGGMSAFVIFSSLGFYPVTPGLPMYVIGSPAFRQAKIKLGNGKTFEIICHNYAKENKYIQWAKLNGEILNRSWFSHDELMNGGQIEFEMGRYPNKAWASEPDSVPPSFSME